MILKLFPEPIINEAYLFPSPLLMGFLDVSCWRWGQEEGEKKGRKEAGTVVGPAPDRLSGDMSPASSSCRAQSPLLPGNSGVTSSLVAPHHWPGWGPHPAELQPPALHTVGGSETLQCLVHGNHHVPGPITHSLSVPQTAR